MSWNRPTILAGALITCVIGVVLFLDHAPPVLSDQATILTFDRQITGNSQMLGAPTAYTVIALPENYQADATSQDVLKDFASDETCLNLRKQTEVVTMTETNPLLTDKEGPLSNVAGTYPMVCVIDGNRCLFKRSGKGCANIGSQLVEVKISRPCPTCPLNKPDKPVTPNKPEVPTIPDTPALPDTPAPTDEKDDFVLFAVLAGAGLATVRYFQG